MIQIADVKGLGRIVELYTDFATGLQEFKREKAKLITPRNEAYARIKTEVIGRNQGTWTTAGVEYMKGELPLLRLNSRLLNPKLAELAVQANRNGKYFHTDSKREYEESFKQAEKDKSKAPSKRRVVVLPSREQFSITGSENFEVLEFLLRDQAKKYFELNGTAISFYPFGKDLVDSQDGTLLTQLWFHSLGGRSGLYGSRDLDFDGRARGVQKSGVATQKKSPQKVEVYTLKQITRALRQLKLSGLEEQVISVLQK